ncbi:MAG: hypothetical protein Q9170_003501 [Blastenia crenularia]
MIVFTARSRRSREVVAFRMTTLTAQAFQPVRIDMPDPQFYTVVTPNNGDSDLEDDQVESTINDGDIQSVIGVSMSRKQTQLKSPIASAGRAGALDPYGGDSFFDLHPSIEHVQIDSADDDSTLPTPWKSGPKLFEKHPLQTQLQEAQKPRPRAATGTMVGLADLNIKRFISGLTLPSLPRTISVRDMPMMPALPAWIGGKVDTPTLAHVQKHRRANSDMSLKSQRWPQRHDSLVLNISPSKSDIPVTLERSTAKATQCTRKRPDGGEETHDPTQRSLKRATSDQSLVLRRATSMASSLGDDSRWEHVQKQVNSRAKAIADTFQDANIRLPSLPSLPSMSVLRAGPDFLRNRATSDTTRPFKPVGMKYSDLEASNGTSHKDQPETVDDMKPVHRLQKSLHPNLESALELLTGDLVILGGYRGSVLRSAKPPHRQLWVPVKVGLNLRRVNLEVGLEPQDEENMEDSIIPSGMLSHIGPVDMGRRLLKRLKSCRNAQEGKLRVHDYGYDWRLSPHLLSRKLVQYLDNLAAESKGHHRSERGAIVIAHSLGGLITRHAVNQRPELFAGVIYAGVPQHCVNILGPLRNGDDVLLSSKVLTAQVNFTLRTSFLLLPEDGRCFINKQTKEEYPVNFFDATEWKRYALSPCIAPASSPFVAPERKSIFSFVTDNLPTLPLIDRRESELYQFSANMKAKGPSPATITDIDPKHDGHSSILLDSPRSTIPLRKAEDYLTRTLADTVRFKAEMRYIHQYAKRNIYPPFSVLYGTSVPTVLRARVASREAIKCKDTYEDLAFASGDGVCLARAAMLPEGYDYVTGGKIRTERGHVGLLGDLEAVGKCLLSILEGRSNGIGLGNWNEREYPEKDHQC